MFLMKERVHKRKSALGPRTTKCSCGMWLPASCIRTLKDSLWVFLVLSFSPNPRAGLEAHTHFSLLPESHLNLLLSSPTGRTTETYPSSHPWAASWVNVFPSLRQWENWWVTFLDDQLFYPIFQPPPIPALNSGHLPRSDFHKWGLWRKKETLCHWRVVCSDGWWRYRDSGRSHVSILKGLAGGLRGGRCAPLAQTRSSPDTPPASSTLSAFTFLIKSIQNNAFYVFLFGL